MPLIAGDSAVFLFYLQTLQVLINLLLVKLKIDAYLLQFLHLQRRWNEVLALLFLLCNKSLLALSEFILVVFDLLVSLVLILRLIALCVVFMFFLLFSPCVVRVAGLVVISSATAPSAARPSMVTLLIILILSTAVVRFIVVVVLLILLTLSCQFTLVGFLFIVTSWVCLALTSAI